MPRENDNTHSQATPHFDGKKESIINDTLATASSRLGIQAEAKEEFAQEWDPFNKYPIQDKQFKQFEKLMRGKKVEE